MTFGFGLGLGGRAAGASVFDPATLTLTGWWRASYTGSPWTPTASAGSSGSNGNLTATLLEIPATGSSVNGYTPPDFDGTDDRLANANSTDTFVDEAAWSVSLLFYGDTAAAHSAGAAYSDEALVSDVGNGFFYVTFTTDGVVAGHYDGVAFQEIVKAASTGAWHKVHAWYDGTNLNLEVDGSAATPVAAGNGFSTFGGGALRVGTNYDATAFFDGKILEVMTATSNLGSTARTNISSYWASRYGV